ncbi:terminase large subunit domain-containing protein [Brevibacillus fortis]|uniref:terminase large subunit domain-containing protein n=1 Tax=Brevibacillus fortis TaxID=2126352 RepID=UPI0038FC7D27
MAKMTKKQKLEKISNDPKLWILNFVKIVDNEGRLIPFKVNDQQEMFIDSMTKFNIISKARQIGFSTLSLALCLYYACTKPNTNYLIVSYKQDSSSSLFERLKSMYDTLPHDKYEFPSIKRSNRGEFLLDNNSRIQCVVAGNKDVGRGSTYEYILLSEFSFFQNQEKVLLSAEQALSKNQNSRIVIETTSNGFNYYQRVFMNAYKGESKYKAFFFPFYSSAYEKQFKHEHDQAEQWYKEQYGVRLSAKELESDEKILHEKGASLKMLMWRRWKLMDIDIQQFYQEFPSNPMESFISTGHSVFDQTKVLERLNYVIPALPYKDIDVELPDMLMPYINKSLFLYFTPKKDRKYYAGVDTASGSGGDNSAVAFYDDDGQHVASFYNNKVPVYKFAEIVNAIGRYYGYAFLVVERNTYGLPLLERLRRDHNYMNLYKHKIFDQKGRKKMQLGWQTSQVSKSIMISDFKEQFELDLININCKETLEQMQIFLENDGKTGNKKGEGNYDDMVIANALAVQGMKVGKWYV